MIQTKTCDQRVEAIRMSDQTSDTPMPLDEEELLPRVAWYYYHDGLTQNAIGERLGLSRIKISRILDAGQRSGLLQVTINSSLHGSFELEREIAERFRLDEVRLIPTLETGVTSERLGQAAAQYLMHKLPAKSMLAVGWGEMVSAAIQRLGHLSNQRMFDLVAMTGGVQSYVDGLRIMGLGRKIYLVPAPLVCSTPELTRLLMEEPDVMNTLNMSLGADYALIGIGSLNENASVLRAGHIHPSELPAMRRLGAVGDVLCRFIDENGEELPLPIHDRVVGLPLKKLTATTRLIAAAAGPEKVDSIRAALNGRFINIFITDETTAAALMS